MSKRTLRSKRKRNWLYLNTFGKCAICGANLSDNWHADHTIPWTISRRTNVFEMQPLCPECNLKKGNKMDHGNSWQAHFASLGLKFRFDKPYRGQSEFFQALIEDRLQDVEVIIEPTGYGKTDQQAMQAAYLFQTGAINNAAIFVPRDNLRSGFVDEWHRILLETGLRPDCFVVLNGSNDLHRIARYNKRFVVVIFCYQQLPDTVISDLTASGDWLIIADEAHHLYQDGQWAKNIADLSFVQKTYYTATPNRGDKKALHDAPYILEDNHWILDPLIQITPRQAQDEKALSRLNLTVFKYWLDIIDLDGTERRIYSDDLSEDELKDFSSYETRKQLRYKPGYLHPMMKRMIEIYWRKHERHPFKHQIIIKAMTNVHAEYLCSEINRYAEDPDFAHWIGIMRQEQVNKEILLRFRGKKEENGTEIPMPDYERFPCLIQVDMAGEGYNNPYISIGCKADLIKNEATVLQFIGRLLRRNYAINNYEDETVDLLVSSDDIATIELVQNAYEINGEVKELETIEGGNGDDFLPSIPDVDVIRAEFDRAFMISDGGGRYFIDDEVRKWAERYLSEDILKQISQDTLRQMFLDVSQAKPQIERPISSVSGDMLYWQEQNKRAAKTATGIVLKLLRSKHWTNGNEQQIAGAIMKAINREWMIRCGGRPIKERTPEEEQQKYSWLKRWVDGVRETREVPEWIMSKLR